MHFQFICCLIKKKVSNDIKKLINYDDDCRAGLVELVMATMMMLSTGLQQPNSFQNVLNSYYQLIKILDLNYRQVLNFSTLTEQMCFGGSLNIIRVKHRVPRFVVQFCCRITQVKFSTEKHKIYIGFDCENKINEIS